jgi:hydrogenase maturation protease
MNTDSSKKSVLIGGIGNVLLGDDAVGPYVIYLLESEYTFGEGVEIADLGTPALDLTHRIVDRRAVILIDCVASAEHAPGTVLLYTKADILRVAPAQRLDPHSPALSECLLATDMLGMSPEKVLLVGIVGEGYEPGRPLSESVREAAEKAIEEIIACLDRLGVKNKKKLHPDEPLIWWGDYNSALTGSASLQKS